LNRYARQEKIQQKALFAVRMVKEGVYLVIALL
jgi:hypothetical protein